MPFVSILTLRRVSRHRIDAWLTLVALIAGVTAAPAWGADAVWHSNADIEATAERHLTRIAGPKADRTQVQAASLDPRHRLPRCDQPLRGFMRRGTTVTSRTVVGVRCDGSKPWKVFVPVDVVVLAHVITASRTLPAGHLVSADDLASAERDVSRMLTGYLDSPQSLIGQRTRQQILAGRVISPSMLEANKIVQRGQTVTLLAAGSTLQVSMSGIALSNGALNQRIRVENLSSGRIVEGVVRSAQQVEILLPTVTSK